MMAWCRGGVKGFQRYIDVSEDLVAENLDVIILMNNYEHNRVNKLIIRLHRSPV